MSSFDLTRLRSRIKPFRLHWFTRLRSTNDHASLLRRKGELFAPAIVLTGHQIAGRGRGSNTWWSDSGSLTVTFVLPIDDHLAPHQLPLVAGLAVRDAAAELARQPDIQLKWPNDVLFEGKKLAGLLCERAHKADLVGLGMNVGFESALPPVLRNRIISLAQVSGESLDKTDALIAIADRFKHMLLRRSEHPFGAILREYDRHHALIGRRVTINGTPDEPPVNGICQGLDSMGRLLVRTRTRLHRVIAGQVELH